jgi:hypothetical protein
VSIRSFLLTRRREAVLDLYIILLAVFLFSTPWLFGYPREAARLEMWITGGAIAAIAALAIVTYATWQEWANVLLGAWLIASPWVLSFAHTRAMHSSIAIGIIVAFLALLELMVRYDSRQETSPPV